MTHAIEIITGSRHPDAEGVVERFTILRCTPVGLAHLQALVALAAGRGNEAKAEHMETIGLLRWTLRVEVKEPKARTAPPIGDCCLACLRMGTRRAYGRCTGPDAATCQRPESKGMTKPATIPLQPSPLTWTEEDGNRFVFIGAMRAWRRAGSQLVELTAEPPLHEDEIHEAVRDAAEVLWPGAAALLALPQADDGEASR